MPKVVVEFGSQLTPAPEPVKLPDRVVEFDTPEAAFAALPGHAAIVGATNAYVVDDKGKRLTPEDQNKKDPIDDPPDKAAGLTAGKPKLD